MDGLGIRTTPSTEQAKYRLLGREGNGMAWHGTERYELIPKVMVIEQWDEIFNLKAQRGVPDLQSRINLCHVNESVRPAFCCQALKMTSRTTRVQLRS